jgi:pyruvate/2-oxoglutarate dehydrogenase complex dihydrolipoamide dehydrogenase (E3) component
VLTSPAPTGTRSTLQPVDLLAVQVVADAGVDVYLGQTTFVKANGVTVDGREFRFKKAVIATGARPVAPAVEGLKRASTYVCRMTSNR